MKAEEDKPLLENAYTTLVPGKVYAPLVPAAASI